MRTDAHYTHQWLRAGDEIFPALLAAINASIHSVCLEIYIVTAGTLAESLRAALLKAQERGVRVRVLVDAVGSLYLAGDFWQELRQSGADVRQFNPLTLRRFWIRNHRKLLVCDRRVAFIGGFNIAPEYEGDGVKKGWWDLGLRLEGTMAEQLEDSFNDMFDRANFHHKRFVRLRKTSAKKTLAGSHGQIMSSGPGRGGSPFTRALYKDLAHAHSVRIITPYFLPPWRMRHDLLRVTRRGGQVQLLLPGKSDVLLSKLAAQSMYRRLLKGGIQIFEYQPQILHAKLIIVDGKVYVGSSNLDPRSLHINYEIMVRFDDKVIGDEAVCLFKESLVHAREVTEAEWHKTHGVWSALKQSWAHFLLTKIDPNMARWQWQSLPK